MKKNVIALLLGVAMSLGLVACGSTTEPVAEETVTEVATEAVPETETETEVVVLPAVEELGIETTTELEYHLPFMAAFTETDENDVKSIATYEGLVIDSSNGADTRIIEASCVPSEEDADYVDVTVVYESTGTMTINEDELKEYPEHWGFNYAFPGWELVDYYTGMIFPDKETIGDEEFSVNFDVTWEDKTYNITYGKNVEWLDHTWYDWEPQNDEETLWSRDYSATVQVTYTAHMPKDYDGLVIMNVKQGADELNPNPETLDENARYYLCQPNKDGRVYAPEDYILVKFTDALAALSNDAEADSTEVAVEATEGDI